MAWSGNWTGFVWEIILLGAKRRCDSFHLTSIDEIWDDKLRHKGLTIVTIVTILFKIVEAETDTIVTIVTNLVTID